MSTNTTSSTPPSTPPPAGTPAPSSSGSVPEPPAESSTGSRPARLIHNEATTEIPVHLLFRDDPAPAPVPLRPAVVARRQGPGERPGERP
ncbi:hypothetical protein ACWDR6_23935, partial [Streptomyces ardesiacus]